MPSYQKMIQIKVPDFKKIIFCVQ